ncbi:MAG: TonB-dependent receptor [Cyclobacteriaceae bacterium]|nr:TonB-dependent receptor [Cyclobacteriaceae bacterium]
MRALIFLSLGFPFFGYSFQQQDSVRILEEVPIHANRIQTGFNETSASIIILQGTTLAQTPSLSVNDVLHYIPGVDIRQRGANGVQADASIRGSTFDQVLILINGIKISDPQTGHHSLNLPIDIENVERIEILKGPAARIFGQNAFAGAINIITKVPENDFVKVSAMAGDFGLGGVRVSGALHDKAGTSHYLSASRDVSDGYQYNTDYVISNYFYQSAWKNSIGKWNVLAGLTDRTFGANGFYASSAFQDQRESIQTSLVALNLQTKPGENFSLNHRLYWRKNSDDYVFNWKNPTAYRNLHTGNTVGYEANGTFQNKLGAAGLGIDLNHLWLASTNLGDHNRTVFTMFAEQRFEFNQSKWDITPGIQLNYYSDFGLNFFPGIDAGYLINKNLKAYGNWGYTYRVPTYTDLYYSDPANEGNPFLEPEFAVSYEAGIKLLNVKWMSGQVAYFVRDGKNIIDWTKDVETDPWRPENLVGVLMKGVDLNTTIIPFENRGFIRTLDLGYTFIDAEKSTDQAYSRYALENLKHQLVTSVLLAYGKHFRHTIYYRYNNRVTMPDYSLVDSRISWQKNGVNMFVDVTNIFDVTYKETNLVTMPGRWFKAGISCQFNRH